MKRRVYLETTIASYLTARPSRDLVVAAHQEITADWWEHYRGRYDLFVSDIVLREAARGDEEAAARRAAELRSINVLRLDTPTLELARAFVERKLIPSKVVEDALHVAVATTQGMNFLLTWNCRHIANAEIMGRLEEVCTEFGYLMPVLCTPEQLMGDLEDERSDH